MPKEVAKVLLDKQLLLFMEMLRDSGTRDDQILFQLTGGFNLVGEFPDSGLSPQCARPDTISMEDLWRSARHAQDAVMRECKPSGDPEIDLAVMFGTVAERDQGWARGPYTPEQLTAQHGPCWVPSRRFGVRQSGKIQLIDGMSEFLINASTGLLEKLELGGLTSTSPWLRQS
jgi:hypothetical protein